MSLYPQLDEAFKKLKEQGVPEEKIRADAKAQGWSDDDITGALAATPEAVYAPGVAVVSEDEVLVEEPTNQNTEKQQKTKAGHTSHAPIYIMLSLLLCVVIAGAAGTYAYMTGFNPFAKAPYMSRDTFATELVANIRTVSSAESQVTATASIENHDAEALPVAVIQSGRDEVIAKYRRDFQRLSTVRDMLAPTAMEKFEKFPDSILDYASGSEASFTIEPDPLTGEQYQYTATEEGENFALTLTLETQEAVDAVKYASNIEISTTTTAVGNTVTFTKDSPISFYVSALPPKTAYDRIYDALLYLSPDFNVSGTATIRKEQAQTEGVIGNVAMQFGGNATAQGEQYALDAEVRSIADLYFYIVNAIPEKLSRFVIENEWVRWTSGENSGFSFNADKIDELYKREALGLSMYSGSIAQAIDETGLITFTNEPTREKVDGKIAYQYELEIDKDALVPFMQKLQTLAQTDETFAQIVPFITDGNIAYIQSESFRSLFDYYVQNTDITLWVSQDGIPVKVTHQTRIIPPESNEAMREKQAMFVIEYVLNQFNADIQIDIPEAAKGYEEIVEGDN